jgi:hypothetical protein
MTHVTISHLCDRKRHSQATRSHGLLWAARRHSLHGPLAALRALLAAFAPRSPASRQSADSRASTLLATASTGVTGAITSQGADASEIAAWRAFIVDLLRVTSQCVGVALELVASQAPEGHALDEDVYGGYFDETANTDAADAREPGLGAGVIGGADTDDDGDDDDGDDDDATTLARPQYITGMPSQLVASLCWCVV